MRLLHFRTSFSLASLASLDLDKREGWRRLGSISCMVGRCARSFVRLGLRVSYGCHKVSKSTSVDCNKIYVVMV